MQEIIERGDRLLHFAAGGLLLIHFTSPTIIVGEGKFIEHLAIE